MQDGGAILIAKGLKHNRGLYHIDLSYNRIRIAGREVISCLLLNNYTLMSINLQQNHLPSMPADNKIQKCLKRNRDMNITTHKISFLMGFHERVGERTAMRRVFRDDYFDIADWNVFKCLWIMLWGDIEPIRAKVSQQSCSSPETRWPTATSSPSLGSKGLSRSQSGSILMEDVGWHMSYRQHLQQRHILYSSRDQYQHVGTGNSDIISNPSIGSDYSNSNVFPSPFFGDTINIGTESKQDFLGFKTNGGGKEG